MKKITKYMTNKGELFDHDWQALDQEDKDELLEMIQTENDEGYIYENPLDIAKFIFDNPIKLQAFLEKII